MPRPKRARPAAPEDFGRIVAAEAWERIKDDFGTWAAAREEVLRGYRINEINVSIRAGNRFMARHLETARTERFDPGSFRASSSLSRREMNMPGSVRQISDREPPVGLSFGAGLPADFVSKHPAAERAVREAIETACQRTGLSLKVLSDVHGGSNWVLDGYLDRPEPGHEPKVDWRDPPTEDDHAARFGP